MGKGKSDAGSVQLCYFWERETGGCASAFMGLWLELLGGNIKIHLGKMGEGMLWNWVAWLWCG